MEKQVYKLDENNYLQKIEVADFDDLGNPIEELGNDIITITLPNGLYKAKWNGAEWIEGVTQEYINSMNTTPTIVPTIEERLASAEEMLTMLMGV